MYSRLSILAAVAILLSVGTGLAQQATTAPALNATGKPVPPPADPAIFANPRQGEADWLASNLINHTIYGPNDEKLGKIIDMMFDDQGKPRAAIIGVGGFLGIGEKNVAIAFSSIKLIETNGNKQWFLSVTKTQLKNAPRFIPLAGRS